VVQFILAWMFLLGLNEYSVQTQATAVGAENIAGISEAMIPFLFSTAASIMLVVMPLITMRLFAEERMNQTLILLTSSPLSSTQIVLGKYFSVLGFVLLFVGLLAAMPLSLALATQLDWGQLAAAVGANVIVGSFCGGRLIFVIVGAAAGDCGGDNVWVFVVAGCVVSVGAFARCVE